MNVQTSSFIKFAYCFVVLGLILPGLGRSGWVGLASGSSALMMLGLGGPLVAMILGCYRIYLVARKPGTLDGPAPSGFAAVLRTLGVVGLYIGAFMTVLSLCVGPIMRMLMTASSDSGAEYFAAYLLVAMVGSVGTLGLLFFELSRLLAFERQAPAPRFVE